MNDNSTFILSAVEEPVLSNAEGFILTSPEQGRRSAAEEFILTSPEHGRRIAAEEPVPQDNPVDTPPPSVSGPQLETRNAEPATSYVRRTGGQPGNQNARKHGLYARYLSGKQLQDYNEVRGVRGVEDELALFRCKLAEMVETEPWNWILLNRIANTILKLEAALPEETPEAEAASRSARIISGYFTYALAAGDERVKMAFDDWMEKRYGGGLVPENESHVQPEADSA